MKNFIVALDIDETLLTTLTTPEHEARCNYYDEKGIDASKELALEAFQMKYLAADERVTPSINAVECTKAQYSPYEWYDVVVINKAKISKIMNSILANKHEIAFVTNSGINAKEIKEFCKKELFVDLPNNFLFRNEVVDKTQALKSFAKIRQIEPADYKNIVLVDNDANHIKNAKKAGFSKSA
jgi:hypothetical protein